MKKIILSLIILFFGANINAQNEIPEANNANTAGTLTFNATTTGTASNIMAVWVQNGTTFVKTLIGSKSGYKTELTTWWASSKGDIVNATTGATRSHGAVTTSWTGQDKTLTTVLADATYTVYIETKEEGKAVKVGSFAFTKGATAQTVRPAAVTGFSNASLVWTPVNTGIDEVKLANLYSVYPNPTNSYVYVNGVDIQCIQLCTLSGNTIYTTNNPKMNLSTLPKGTYLAVIVTNNGTVIKKVQRK
jgi:hypothetical protein